MHSGGVSRGGSVSVDNDVDVAMAVVFFFSFYSSISPHPET